MRWILHCGSLKKSLRPVPRKRKATVTTAGAAIGFQDEDQ